MPTILTNINEALKQVYTEKWWGDTMWEDDYSRKQIEDAKFYIVANRKRLIIRDAVKDENGTIEMYCGKDGNLLYSFPEGVKKDASLFLNGSMPVTANTVLTYFNAKKELKAGRPKS